jgi:hypothetical protein
MQEEHREKVMPEGMKRGVSWLSLRVSTQFCSFGLFYKPNFDGPHCNLRTGGKSQLG